MKNTIDANSKLHEAIIKNLSQNERFSIAVKEETFTTYDKMHFRLYGTEFGLEIECIGEVF